jgi:hypothetical protein
LHGQGLPRDKSGGGTIIPDFEGQEFATLAEAKREAEAVLRELIGDDIATAAPLHPRSIAIHDEDHNLLAAVSLIATLEKEERCAGGAAGRPKT